MKRILDGNVNPMNGEVDTDKATRAIMTHRNTPNQETGTSPAESLFGYKIRDHLPDKFQATHRTWKSDKKSNGSKNQPDKMPKPGKNLRPLNVGDEVRIQNQIGRCPKKWSNTGKIIEVKPYRQYLVMPKGSNRATLRNRKFLRKTSEVRQSRRSEPSTTIPNNTPPQPSVEESGVLRTDRVLKSPHHIVPTPPNSMVQEDPLRSPCELQSEVPASSPAVEEPHPVPEAAQGNESGGSHPEDAQAETQASRKRISRTLLELADHNNRGLREDVINEEEENPGPRRSNRTRYSRKRLIEGK